MQEEWVRIEDFPNYAVSNLGQVCNLDIDRLKVPSINQAGVVHVLLIRDGRQFRRAVSGLVARAFLEPPRYDHFNALIHLDNDKTNCRVDNLMWRPRWFAIKYHKQFRPGEPRGFTRPVKELTTGEEFPTSWEAAIKYGLLDHEIKIATLNRTYVFPTGQRFRVLDY